MTWNELSEEVKRGAKPLYTDTVPGGWTFALYYPATDSRAARIYPTRASLSPEEWHLLAPSIGYLRSEDILRSLDRKKKAKSPS